MVTISISTHDGGFKIRMKHWFSNSSVHRAAMGILLQQDSVLSVGYIHQSSSDSNTEGEFRQTMYHFSYCV